MKLGFALIALTLALTLPGSRLLAAESTDVPKELLEYVKKPDAAYSWKLKAKVQSKFGDVYDLHLVSQKWQNWDWEHGVQIFVPAGGKPQKTLLIYNTGGEPNPANLILGMALAERVKAPIAFLYGIPRQPIFDKKEDSLIAETFVRYLESGDASWPLLFPMAKSLVRCMDMLQAFGKKEWNFEIEKFVVSGASKRGWTSWMTAATGDPRVKAIIPLVIDTLNFKAQMPNQLKSYGAYSVMIKDYTERNLIKDKPNEKEEKLWKMVDPYSYRSVIKQPKLIVNGTNDPYWTQDGLNLYWDDLQGDKCLLYVPNAGHGLEQSHGMGKKDRERVLNTLCAFARSHIEDKPFPQPSWKYTPNGDGWQLDLDGGNQARSFRRWKASSDTRDFRKSTWTEQPVESERGKVRVQLQAPSKGFNVSFVEIDYEMGNLKYTLSSQLKIIEAKK